MLPNTILKVRITIIPKDFRNNNFIIILLFSEFMIHFYCQCQDDRICVDEQCPIRTNCRGQEDDSPEDGLKWAADAYNMLLEYAIPANIGVLIENHGGFSNDAGWMVRLKKEVDHPLFGIESSGKEAIRTGKEILTKYLTL